MATASLSAKKVSAGTRARKSTKPISKPISKPVKFSSPALEGCLSLSFVNAIAAKTAIGICRRHRTTMLRRDAFVLTEA